MKLFSKAILMLVLLSSAPLLAQTGKHFRVVEIENFLKTKVEKAFVSRFPEYPYLISVSIIPLRELNGNKYALDEDGLPYFEVEQKRIDEWDDPKISKYELLSRVKQIKVTLHLPDVIAESDISDFKEALYSNINLVAGRDEIAIFRKNWEVEEVPIRNYLLISSLLLLGLLGLWFVLRASVGRKLANAIEKSGKKDSGEVNSSPAPASFPANTGTQSTGNLAGMKETLSLRLTDTLKVKHFVVEMVDSISKHPHFPAIKDMLELEALGEEHPGQLGAVLMCFPVEQRRKLFGLSKGNYWLDALYSPTEIGPESLVALERIERHLNDTKDPQWQELLIRSWRMGEELSDYLLKIEKTEALAILADLPQDISIPMGRKAFPGSWGILLESEAKHEKLSSEQIVALIHLAKEFNGDRDESIFDIYRKDKELLKFLRLAGVDQEREVYTTLPHNSMISEIRPPFYKVLEAEEYQLDNLMSWFAIENWALALFNVSREERKYIEGFFGPKELKVYRSYLMGFDGNPPDLEAVGLARENIAKKLNNMAKSEELKEFTDENLSVA